MSINQATYYLGIDVGSVSIKICLMCHQNNLTTLKNIYNSNSANFEPVHNISLRDKTPVSFLISKYQRTKGEPFRSSVALLLPFINLLSAQDRLSLSVTGSSGKVLSHQLDVHFQNEFQAVARSIGEFYPEIRTILEIGGDSSKFIAMDKTSSSNGTGIMDYEINGDCAAGTGSFLDQQATRLLYQIEDVGEIVSKAGKAANIAGRCSVFAKSDMIHAQQKGFLPPEILKGLCRAVVRNFKGTIIKGKEILPPIAFTGGVAANKGIVEALKEILNIQDDQLIIPKFYAAMEAVGSALLSADCDSSTTVEKLELKLKSTNQSLQSFETIEPLKKDNIILLRDQHRTHKYIVAENPVGAFLGIDIGSVTTKLAIIDSQGNLIKGIYTKTQARPIEVVKAGLNEIEKEFGLALIIKGVGTTGSGRELIGELVSADIVKDEITAHKTGAAHICKIFKLDEVDTIFDIGGQDSKYISLENGVVTDFTMNEACAAGTGSFLEEQAEKLGINIKDEFARLAFSSQTPIRLGERCTVFMEKEITPFLQRGAARKDIAAGLAYSIVTNYLNRVVRGRKIGTVIFFQGGTAYNDAVAAAFSMVLKKKIIVPPHNGILGAIGAALLAQKEINQHPRKSSFRGFDLDNVEYKLRSFTCKGCTNFCDIQEFDVEGKKTFWGDKCSERYRKEIRTTKMPLIPDLIKIREELLLSNYQAKNNNLPTIGIPRAMYFFDQFPFWHTYFREIGFNVILSDETNRQSVNAGIESRVAEPCFPITAAHGHFQNLIDKNVDYIFVPNVIDAESSENATNSFYCPWGQTLCFVLKFTPKFMAFANKILAPNIRYRLGKEVVKEQYLNSISKIGVSAQLNNRAIDSAYDAWYDFQKQLKQLGQETVQKILAANEKAVILLGRPYNLYDKIINLNIPNKLRLQYGINTIPLDFLSPDKISIADINDNMYWNYGQKILKTARWTNMYKNFSLIYITNFKCGPDSYIKHYVREAAQKPYLTIQFDEHGNDAGIITRCEAYLDSQGFLN